LRQFTLGAGERLKSRKQIGRVFNEGRHLNLSPLRVSWHIEPSVVEEPLQVGVGASGRHFKKAVDRNRIKRLLREAWRLQRSPLKEALSSNGKRMYVFIIFTGRELPEMQVISVKVKEAIEKLIQQVNEIHSQGA
jgi:ribonuclease P protein component